MTVFVSEDGNVQLQLGGRFGDFVDGARLQILDAVLSVSLHLVVTAHQLGPDLVQVHTVLHRSLDLSPVLRVVLCKKYQLAHWKVNKYLSTGETFHTL